MNWEVSDSIKILVEKIRLTLWIRMILLSKRVKKHETISYLVR